MRACTVVLVAALLLAAPRAPHASQVEHSAGQDQGVVPEHERGMQSTSAVPADGDGGLQAHAPQPGTDTVAEGVFIGDSLHKNTATDGSLQPTAVEAAPETSVPAQPAAEPGAAPAAPPDPAAEQPQAEPVDAPPAADLHEHVEPSANAAVEQAEETVPQQVAEPAQQQAEETAPQQAEEPAQQQAEATAPQQAEEPAQPQAEATAPQQAGEPAQPQVMQETAPQQEEEPQEQQAPISAPAEHVEQHVEQPPSATLPEQPAPEQQPAELAQEAGGSLQPESGQQLGSSQPAQQEAAQLLPSDGSAADTAAPAPETAPQATAEEAQAQQTEQPAQQTDQPEQKAQAQQAQHVETPEQVQEVIRLEGQDESPEEAARAAAARAAAEAERAAAEALAAEARKREEAARAARLRAAEDELRRAEDLVGWAADEDGVDVPRGLAMLRAMLARLEAHVDAALGEAATRRRTYTAPPPPPPPPEAAGAAAAGAPGGEAQAASNETQAAAADAAAGRADGAAATAGDAATPEGAASAVAVEASAGAGGDGDRAADSVAPAPAPAPPPTPSLNLTEHPELAPLSDAAFTLASLLSCGLAAAHGAPRDDAAALRALHAAALAGSIEARVALVDRYATGRGVPRWVEVGLDYAKTAGPELLTLLDEAGIVNSEGGGHLRRKWMDAGYLPAANVWEDANTLHLEQDAAARGDVEARRQLGFRMLMGQGMPRDLAGAHAEFAAAAAAGDPYAQLNLGFMHVRGWHVAQNYSEARRYFQLAADKGLAGALNGMGVLHFHGQGVPANLSEAFRLFREAADRDHDAAYNLGTMYQGAHGVPRNMSAAVEMFENATAMGSWRAPHQLFMVYSDGLYGAPRNHTLALKNFWHFMAMTGGWKEAGKEAADRSADHDPWGAAVRYALLAEQGNSLAQLNLAWLLHRGGAYAGADRHRLALPLWLRAAARNQTEGMLVAGHVLREGDKWGLPGGANASGAVALYRQAAAAGSIEALYTMGQLLERGELGVARNVSEAIRLYRQAVHTAPAECYATAPFFALWWLRVRLAAAPLLRLAAAHLPALAPLAGGGRGVARLAAGVAARPGEGVPVGPRGPGLRAAQWDSVLIALMLGALTWVLWRKRQLSQQRAATPQPPAQQRQQQQQQQPAPAAEALPDQREPLAAGPSVSAAGLRHRPAASSGSGDAAEPEDAAPDAPPNARL